MATCLGGLVSCANEPSALTTPNGCGMFWILENQVYMIICYLAIHLGAI
jgi:hypothetical protein